MHPCHLARRGCVTAPRCASGRWASRGVHQGAHAILPSGDHRLIAKAMGRNAPSSAQRTPSDAFDLLAEARARWPSASMALCTAAAQHPFRCQKRTAGPAPKKMVQGVPQAGRMDKSLKNRGGRRPSRAIGGSDPGDTACQRRSVCDACDAIAAKNLLRPKPPQSVGQLRRKRSIRPLSNPPRRFGEDGINIDR